MSPDGKSVRGDRFPVADAFEERVAGDDVFVFTCSCYFSIVRFKEEEQKREKKNDNMKRKIQGNDTAKNGQEKEKEREKINS